MFFKVIVIVSVFYNAITFVKTDDVLVIDPRDLRLFESVWKLGLTSRNSPGSIKTIKTSPFSYNSPLVPKFKSSTIPPSSTDGKVDFYTVGEEEFHNFKSTIPADGKFLRKMFTPKYSEKYFGTSKNFDTKDLFSTIANNDIVMTTQGYVDINDNDATFSTRKPRAKKARKYKFKTREYNLMDKESYK